MSRKGDKNKVLVLCAGTEGEKNMFVQYLFHNMRLLGRGDSLLHEAKEKTPSRRSASPRADRSSSRPEALTTSARETFSLRRKTEVKPDRAVTLPSSKVTFYEPPSPRPSSTGGEGTKQEDQVKENEKEEQEQEEHNFDYGDYGASGTETTTMNSVDLSAIKLASLDYYGNDSGKVDSSKSISLETLMLPAHDLDDEDTAELPSSALDGLGQGDDSEDPYEYADTSQLN